MDSLRVAAICACVLPGCSWIIDGPPATPDPDPAFTGCFQGTDEQGDTALLRLDVAGKGVTGCLLLNQNVAPDRIFETLSGETSGSDAAEITLTLKDSLGEDKIRAILDVRNVGDADDLVTLEGIGKNIEGGSIEGMTRGCPDNRDECEELMGGTP